MIVIEAGKIIDGTGSKPKTGYSLVIENGLIRDIVKTNSLQKTGDMDVVDAKDKTIIPGLIDCHVHLTSPGGPNYNNFYSQLQLTKNQAYLTALAINNIQKDLMMGFTSIRVLSTPSNIDIGLRNAINEGLIVGPRMLVAGQGICVTGGHMDKPNWSIDVEVTGRTGVDDGPWGLRRAAREQLKRGADLLKINISGGAFDPKEPWHQEMTFEEMKAVIDEAHMAKKKVAAHASGGPSVTDAINAGLDSVEHGTWLTKKQTDMMADKGMFYIPTLTVHTVGKQLGREGIGGTEASFKWIEQVCDDRWPTLERAKQSGVKICTGTDAGFWVYHGENAQELEELMGGGFTALEAINAATLVGAECLGIEKSTGSIEKGKDADLVIVDGDLLKDMKVLRKPENIIAVYKKGVKVK